MLDNGVVGAGCCASPRRYRDGVVFNQTVRSIIYNQEENN